VNNRPAEETETEPEHGLRDRYFRERRLLLGISAVLLAHQFLGISVASSADSLGLHFEIQDPQRLWWAVWALWLWSFISCVQQRNSLKPYLRFPRDRLAKTYETLQLRFARLKIFLAVRASFIRQVKSENRIKYFVGIAKLRTLNISHAGGRMTTEKYPQSQIELQWCRAPENPRAVRLVDDTSAGDGWIVQTSSDGIVEDGERRYHRGSISTPWLKSRWLASAAVAWTWISTSYFADYVAPALVGVAPVVVAAYQLNHAPQSPSPATPQSPSRVIPPRG
jgi:hypothetical protein